MTSRLSRPVIGKIIKTKLLLIDSSTNTLSSYYNVILLCTLLCTINAQLQVVNIFTFNTSLSLRTAYAISLGLAQSVVYTLPTPISNTIILLYINHYCYYIYAVRHVLSRRSCHLARESY
jgi:hypothetical protein